MKLETIRILILPKSSSEYAKKIKGKKFPHEEALLEDIISEHILGKNQDQINYRIVTLEKLHTIIPDEEIFTYVIIDEEPKRGELLTLGFLYQYWKGV